MLKALSVLCISFLLLCVFPLAVISCGDSGTGTNTGNEELSSSAQEASSSGTETLSSGTTSSSSNTLSSSFGEQSSSPFVHVLDTGSFEDARDNQNYKYTKIGNQVWMAENLNYETTSGSYCYEDLPANCETYGRLYTWDAAMAGAPSSDSAGPGPQGICPDGWHVPSDAEWTELTDYVIANTAGTSTTNISPYLNATTGWSSGGNGTDDFGFSALPGGRSLNDGNNGSFGRLGDGGYWWSATEFDSDYAWYRNMFYNDEYVYRNYLNKDYGYSLRCLQD